MAKTTEMVSKWGWIVAMIHDIFFKFDTRISILLVNIAILEKKTKNKKLFFWFLLLEGLVLLPLLVCVTTDSDISVGVTDEQLAVARLDDFHTVQHCISERGTVFISSGTKQHCASDSAVAAISLLCATLCNWCRLSSVCSV